MVLNNLYCITRSIPHQWSNLHKGGCFAITHSGISNVSFDCSMYAWLPQIWNYEFFLPLYLV